MHSTLSESDPERKLSIVVRVEQGASQKHSARGGLSMRPARRFEIIGDKTTRPLSTRATLINLRRPRDPYDGAGAAKHCWFRPTTKAARTGATDF